MLIMSIKRDIQVILILKVRWLVAIIDDKLDISHFKNFRMNVIQNIYKYSEKKVILFGSNMVLPKAVNTNQLYFCS